MDSYHKLFILGSNPFYRFLIGEKPLPAAENSNPHPNKLWHEFNLRKDYERYEAFQEFVEKYWFRKPAPDYDNSAPPTEGAPK